MAAELGGRSLEVHTFGLDEREALIEHLRGTLQPGDIVLLKGSRGLEMENIVAASAHRHRGRCRRSALPRSLPNSKA